MSPAEAALDYLRRGLRPVPVPYRSKNPNRPEWQKERWTEADIPARFVGNVGVIVGAGDYVDVDLDRHSAIAAAPIFLPSTGSIFGRASKPRAHYGYRCSPLPKTKKFIHPLDRKMIVELRAAASAEDKHLQTIWPPSVHPSGEVVTFDNDDEMARVDGAELLHRVSLVAATALLASVWPSGPSCRHDLSLALGGFFARGGLDVDIASAVVEHASHIAGDTEYQSRGGDVRDTYQNMTRGSNVTGVPTLKDLAGRGRTRCEHGDVPS
jgi:hypothetical protein